MKKMIVFICLLVSVCFLLPACTTNSTTGSSPSDTSIESKSADGTADDGQSDKFNEPEQNEVYFAVGNDYYDLYVNYSYVPGPEITLFSREYIDPDSIQVSADIQTAYKVYVTEQIQPEVTVASYEIIESEGKRNASMVSRNQYDFPLYIYQTYAGMDWADLGQKYRELHELSKKYDAEEVSYDQVAAAQDRYNYAATEYIREYMEINVDEIPKYYEYLIQVYISSNVETEETLTTVQVTVGDAVYDLDIGEVRIRTYPAVNNYDYLDTPMSPPLCISCFPYGNGIEQCQSGVYYAEEFLTFTGLRFLENIKSSITVLDVVAVIADDAESANMGTGIEIEWDGATPVYVEQGKYITLFITFQDDRLKELTYHSKLYPVLEYECGGSSYEHIQEIPLLRIDSPWLIEATCLYGLDMESYFNDYHYWTVNEVWRNDVDLTPWGQEE